MQKILVPLTILAAFFVAPVVLAQDSPFGNLKNEPVFYRKYENTDGTSLKDYLGAKDTYENLQELYERAFGTRKTELEEQILASSKDTQVTKLGAVQTYLKDLLANLISSERASEESIIVMEGITEEFILQTPTFQERVESSQSVEEVIEVSGLIKGAAEISFEAVLPHLSLLTAARGNTIINLIEKKADVIQRHITASADLGGDVLDAQELFEDSMLSLESARDAYSLLAIYTGNNGSALSDMEKQLSTLTTSLEDTSSGLSEVLDELRVLYGQSPWVVDITEYEEDEEVSVVPTEEEGVMVEEGFEEEL